jgi:hypothetical protein
MPINIFIFFRSVLPASILLVVCISTLGVKKQPQIDEWQVVNRAEGTPHAVEAGAGTLLGTASPAKRPIKHSFAEVCGRRQRVSGASHPIVCAWMVS